MRILIPQWHIHNQKCVGEVNHWLEQRVNVLLSEVYLKWFLTASVAQAAVWAWKEGPWADLREAVELTKKQKIPWPVCEFTYRPTAKALVSLLCHIYRFGFAHSTCNCRRKHWHTLMFHKHQQMSVNTCSQSGEHTHLNKGGKRDSNYSPRLLMRSH